MENLTKMLLYTFTVLAILVAAEFAGAWFIAVFVFGVHIVILLHIIITDCVAIIRDIIRQKES